MQARKAGGCGGSGCGDRGCIGVGRIGMRSARDVNDEQILAGVVDGDVLMRLKKAQLADFFRADAAGGEVGDAARFELDADVGDVHFAREDRQTDSVQRVDRRLDEAENDIQVMHHQIEDHIDVEGTGAEDAEPMGLEKHGVIQDGQRSNHPWIEPLKVTCLQNALVLRCEIDKTSGLANAGGNGLLDQNIDARGEQRIGNFKVSRSRSGD